MANVFDTAKYILEQSGSMSGVNSLYLMKIFKLGRTDPFALNYFSRLKGSIP